MWQYFIPEIGLNSTWPFSFPQTKESKMTLYKQNRKYLRGFFFASLMSARIVFMIFECCYFSLEAAKEP